MFIIISKISSCSCHSPLTVPSSIPCRILDKKGQVLSRPTISSLSVGGQSSLASPLSAHNSNDCGSELGSSHSVYPRLFQSHLIYPKIQDSELIRLPATREQLGFCPNICLNLLCNLWFFYQIKMS